MNKVLITTLSKLIVKEVPSGSLSVFLPHGTWTMVIQEWWAAGQTVNQMKGTQSSARVRCRYAFLEVSSFRSSLFFFSQPQPQPQPQTHRLIACRQNRHSKFGLL